MTASLSFYACRWAQVTEELKDEREKRRRAEEEINVKAHEQDNLKNKLSALLEERDKEREEMKGREKEKERETSLLLPSTFPGKEPEKLQGELREVQEESAVLLSHLKQQEQLGFSLQEMKQAGDSVTSEVQTLFGKQLQALQVHL